MRSSSSARTRRRDRGAIRPAAFDRRRRGLVRDARRASSGHGRGRRRRGGPSPQGARQPRSRARPPRRRRGRRRLPGSRFPCGSHRPAARTGPSAQRSSGFEAESRSSAAALPGLRSWARSRARWPRDRPSAGSVALQRTTAGRSDRRTCPTGNRARQAGTEAARRPSPRCRVRGHDCRAPAAQKPRARPACSGRRPRQHPARPVAGMHESPPLSPDRTSRRRFRGTRRGREGLPGARQPSGSGQRRPTKPARAAG